MDFIQKKNSEEIYRSLKGLDIANLSFINKKEFLEKLRSVYTAIIVSSTQSRIHEEYDPKDGITYLHFYTASNEKQKVNKEFINSVFFGEAQLVFDDIKNKLQNREEHSTFLAISMVNAFSQNCYRDTKVEKDLNSFMKWLAKYVESPQKDNNEVKQSLTDWLMMLALKDDYDTTIQDHYSHAINSFMKYNILNPELLLDTNYFDQYTDEQIMSLSQDGIIKSNQIIRAMGEEKYKNLLLNVQENLQFWETNKQYPLHYYEEKEIQTNIRKYQKQFSDLISVPGGIPSIIDVYLSGDLEEASFLKIFNRVQLEEQSHEHIMGLLKSKMSSKIKTSSESLLKLYGTKLSGSDCIELAKLGRIEPEKLIDIAKYESIKVSTPDLAVDSNELISFYTPELLLKMHEDGKINPNFSKKFINLVEGNLDVVSQEILYVDIVKNTTDQTVILDYFKNGLVPPQSLKGFVGIRSIDDMYLDEELTMKDILSLVQSGVIRIQDTDRYFTSEEIIEHIVDGKLSEDFLNALDKNFVESKLKDLYRVGKCPPDLFVKAFLDYDVISLDTVNQAFEEKEPEIDLLQLITAESNKEKIKALFTNYHISYEDLFTLLHNEIINKETFDEIKSAIDKADFYRQLAETKRISVSTSERNKKSSMPVDLPISNNIIKSKIDFELEKQALMETYDTPIFGRDSMPIIDSFNTATGHPTTLNNYIVIPIEKYDLVMFEKFAPDNMLYIMPYQQADYFLHGKLELLELNGVGLDFNKSKKTLREMESVQICSHSRHFWKNVIDKSVQLSEKAQADLKPKGKYSPLAKKHMKIITERYDENKNESHEKGE